jgi:MinD superfamily P-loop ATPase
VKEIVVCSGKGGTGKTSVVASLAALAPHAVFADCDVDAANLHLALGTEPASSRPFMAGREAVIRTGDCRDCGICREVCRFGAVTSTRYGEAGEKPWVDPLRCEGCGVCVHFCPEGAIDFFERRCGTWSVSRTARGPLVHADLDPGAENSGKLVTKVREEARRLAADTGRDLILVDGPPGIACPATAAITGSDLVLLVTEPSLSALHDLDRIADLVARFGIPAAVLINRHDLSPALTGRIEAYCTDRGLPLVGKIPFDPAVDDAQRAGKSLVEHAPRRRAAEILTGVWRTLERRLESVLYTKG